MVARRLLLLAVASVGAGGRVAAAQERHLRQWVDREGVIHLRQWVDREGVIHLTLGPSAKALQCICRFRLDLEGAARRIEHGEDG